MLDFSDDQVSRSMLRGLSDGFRRELKDHLLDVAMESIDDIVGRTVKRMEVSLNEFIKSDDILSRNIRLTWLLRQEKSA
jgi:hypothetical protein